jgi:hypothetical protein
MTNEPRQGRKEEVPRPLSSDELAILTWVLEHGLPEARTFFPQVEGIRASKWCDCGCPSIHLHVRDEAPIGICPFTLISDVLGKTIEDKRVGILLFQKDGRLSSLEVYETFDPIEGEWGLPVFDSLQTWEDLGRSTMKDSN